jgi:hypothetical protein
MHAEKKRAMYLMYVRAMFRRPHGSVEFTSRPLTTTLPMKSTAPSSAPLLDWTPRSPATHHAIRRKARLP